MGRVTVLLMLLAAALTAPGVLVAQNASEQMRVLFPRAELMLRTGDVEGAVATLDRLIELGEAEAVAELEADRLLLRRAYELRVSLRWEEGARNGIDADLDRVVELDPAYEPGEAMPAALRERFRSRRQRKVGFLRIGRFPADAGVSVDGRELEEVPELLPLLAGDHVVVGSRPGFAPVREEVRVRANRTEGVGIELARSSATLRLATSPSGAALTVDGDLFGTTRAAGGGDTGDVGGPSGPLIVDGLLPGWHDIEVTLAGYQTFRQRIEIPDLTDYDLGMLEMRRSVGNLLLRGLPAGARILVDGELTGPDDAAGTAAIDTARIGLAIGPHELMVDGGRAGVFATSFAIEEGGTTSIDVRVRPAIAWLGAFGGDALDRDAARSAILPALERLEDWALLDRPDEGETALRSAGGSAAALAAGAEEVWASFRGEAREASGAGVFIAAVLPEERPAAWADLWIWGAEEAIAPERLRVDLGTREGLEPLVASLAEPLPGARPWLGALLIDDPAGGAVVIDVPTGSPAAQGGLRFGDRVVGFEGQPVLSAGDLWRRVATAQPFAGVVLEVEGATGPRSLLATLGSSPYVPLPHEQGAIPAIAWAAAASGAARVDSVYPAWSLQLLQAVLLIDAGDPESALDLLAAVAAPGDAPFGQAAVEYRRAVAKLALPRPDVEGAVAALTVAASLGGRLSHNDGPLVAPLAKARLRALDGTTGDPR